MPKYINADEMIIDENEAYLTAQAKPKEYADFLVNQVVHLKLQRLLADAPAEDVQEVRHGHWYWYENKNSFYEDEFECGWKCSCCDSYPDHDNYMADEYEYMPQLKYCPNCGCKMDESATDTNVGSRKE